MRSRGRTYKVCLRGCCELLFCSTSNGGICRESVTKFLPPGGLSLSAKGRELTSRKCVQQHLIDVHDGGSRTRACVLAMVSGVDLCLTGGIRMCNGGCLLKVGQ